MSRSSKLAAAHKSSDADEVRNMERLKALRLAREAASREAGTWGELSVGEIVHEPSGAVFVHHWRGRDMLPLGPMLTKRPVDLTIDEHRTVAEWLKRHRMTGFEQTLLGWDLSAEEAKRQREARLAALRAAGTTVINDAIEARPAAVKRGKARAAG